MPYTYTFCCCYFCRSKSVLNSNSIHSLPYYRHQELYNEFYISFAVLDSGLTWLTLICDNNNNNGVHDGNGYAFSVKFSFKRCVSNRWLAIIAKTIPNQTIIPFLILFFLYIFATASANASAFAVYLNAFSVGSKSNFDVDNPIFFCSFLIHTVVFVCSISVTYSGTRFVHSNTHV